MTTRFPYMASLGGLQFQSSQTFPAHWPETNGHDSHSRTGVPGSARPKISSRYSPERGTSLDDRRVGEERMPSGAVLSRTTASYSFKYSKDGRKRTAEVWGCAPPTRTVDPGAHRHAALRRR